MIEGVALRGKACDRIGAELVLLRQLHELPSSASNGHKETRTRDHHAYGHDEERRHELPCCVRNQGERGGCSQDGEHQTHDGQRTVSFRHRAEGLCPSKDVDAQVTLVMEVTVELVCCEVAEQVKNLLLLCRLRDERMVRLPTQRVGGLAPGLVCSQSFVQSLDLIAPKLIPALQDVGKQGQAGGQREKPLQVEAHGPWLPRRLAGDG
mmetsp:Transcript_84196/g.234822  ORF Transcript_84196/g.234822 Transcript_84196/m.234822 type:complete len:208 (+) Transcript_84196:262-885(+)